MHRHNETDPILDFMVSILTGSSFFLSVTEYKYMYKAAVKKRNRAPQDVEEDISSRLKELSCGHGGRTPMPEIEMLEEVHAKENCVTDLHRADEAMQIQPSSSGGASSPSEEGVGQQQIV